MLPIPLFQTQVSVTPAPEATLWSFGAYGGYIIVPIDYTGSTASGRTLELGVTGSGTYSAQYISENFGSIDNGIYNDGTDWSTFNFGTIWPTIDPTGSQGSNSRSMLSTNQSWGQEVGLGYSIRYITFDTSTSVNGPTQVTGTKNAVIFNFKANTKVALWTGAPTTWLSGVAYIYDGTSANNFTLSGTQSSTVKLV